MQAEFIKGPLLPNLQEYFGVNAVFLFWLSSQLHCLRLSAQRCVLQLHGEPEQPRFTPGHRTALHGLQLPQKHALTTYAKHLLSNVHYAEYAILKATLRLRSSIFEFVIIKCGLSVEEQGCGLCFAHVSLSQLF